MRHHSPVRAERPRPATLRKGRRAIAGAAATLCGALLIPALGAQTDTALIQPSEIQYLGAFRLPAVSGPGYSTWEYSNGALAYYPLGDAGGPNDGFPGSIFMAGHMYESRVAEMSVPVPVISRDLSKLPVAGLLQPMVDVAAALPRKNGQIYSMAYVPSQGRMFFTHGSDYSDQSCSVSSTTIPGLGSFSPNLESAATNGLWFLSRNGARLHPYQSLRWVMDVPQQWADAYTAGRTLVTGRYRGWCPEGPSLYASAPWAVGFPSAEADIPVTTLLHPGATKMAAHSPSHGYRGGAWLTSGSRGAAVISGVIDFDPAKGYYGYADWKYPTDCEPTNSCVGGRGWRTGDGRPALLMFRPSDLAQVAAGTKDPGSLEPYAKFDMSPYMLRTYGATFLVTGTSGETALMAFDRTRGIVFVSESFGDGNRPVVHVFRLGGGGSNESDAPSAPSDLRILYCACACPVHA